MTKLVCKLCMTMGKPGNEFIPITGDDFMDSVEQLAYHLETVHNIVVTRPNETYDQAVRRISNINASILFHRNVMTVEDIINLPVEVDLSRGY